MQMLLYARSCTQEVLPFNFCCLHGESAFCFVLHFTHGKEELSYAQPKGATHIIYVLWESLCVRQIWPSSDDVFIKTLSNDYYVFLSLKYNMNYFKLTCMASQIQIDF
jgi:hypothetical protein